MKYERLFLPLLWMLLSLSVSAAEYVGTMQMASGYTLSDVRVRLDEQGNLTLFRVKFARMMPVRVDVVLPSLTLRQDGSAIVFSGDSIIPMLNDRPKPDRLATQLQGKADSSSIAFHCLLGGKAMQFKGKKK